MQSVPENQTGWWTSEETPDYSGDMIAIWIFIFWHSVSPQNSIITPRETLIWTNHKNRA